MAHTTEIAYWQTLSELGTLAPGETFSFDLVVQNADRVAFVSGTYPGTLTISGTTASLSGAAGFFIANKGYDFTLRAYHEDGVTDQSFHIEVNAVDPITWNSGENLGYLTVGTQRTIQLGANYDGTLEYELISGGLPPGMFLDGSGIIYGIVGASDLEAPTMDVQDWTVRNPVGRLGGAEYMFTVRALDTENRGQWADRTFTLKLIDADQISADQIMVDASDDLLTVDSVNYLLPVVLTPGGTLPVIRHDNQYIFQIKAWDPGGKGLEWSFVENNQGYDTDSNGYEAEPQGFDGWSPDQPSFLYMERFNGYISGKVPFQRYNNQDYEFTVRIRRVDALGNDEFIDTTLGYDSVPYNEYDGPDIELQNEFGSDPVPPPTYLPDNADDYTYLYDSRFAVDGVYDTAHNYVLPVKGDGDLDFDWYWGDKLLTSTEVKTITLTKGEISNYSLRAVWKKDPNAVLYYELNNGSLPLGLEITAFGSIAGRAAFAAETKVYTFEVKTYDPAEEVQEGKFPTASTRTFKIDLKPAMAGIQEITEVYDSYYRAYMSQDQRTIWQNLITDSNVFPNRVIYRPDDPRFGRRYELEFLAIPGISEWHAAEFMTAVRRNFSYKRFGLGTIHATTVYEGTEALYDVVYVDVFDTKMLQDLRSTNTVLYARSQRSYVDSLGNVMYTNLASVDSLDITVDSTDITADATSNQIVYPASIKTQRERLREGPGQATDSLLPQWLKSPQPDGRPLGMIPAAVLAFVQAGTGAEIIRKIRRSTHNVKAIDFQVDRLVLKDTPISLDGTSFDPTQTQDKYIMFEYDGDIYGIKN